jgi:hypothetical protein
VYDNLALLLGTLRSIFKASVCRLLFVFALVEQGSYSQAECPSLLPAAICKRGIVGCRRGQMPCFVGSVEARAVSCECVSREYSH